VLHFYNNDKSMIWVYFAFSWWMTVFYL